MSTNGTPVDGPITRHAGIKTTAIDNTGIDSTGIEKTQIGDTSTGQPTPVGRSSHEPLPFVAKNSINRSAARPTQGSHRSTEAVAPTKAYGAMPLPAAMGYCARRLLEALNGVGDAGAHAALDALTPSTQGLLAWWFGRDACRRRHRNFHQGQQEVILHTILAHELFGSDDPSTLFRAACSAWPSEASATATRHAHAASTTAIHPMFHAYRLRLAPGAGGRWALQALLVWQWAGDAATRARRGSDACIDTRIDARFDARFALIAASPAIARRFDEALFGIRRQDGSFDASNSSFLRHAELFLPPHLRASFTQWLDACNDAASSPLRIGTLDDAQHHDEDGGRDRDADRYSPTRLVVGDGARSLAQDNDRGHDMNTHARTSHEAGRVAFAQPRDASQRAVPVHAPHLLWIELGDSSEAPPAHVAVLADLPLARALHIGAVKSLLLVDLGIRQRRTSRCHRPSAQRHRHLRPVLPRRERPMLETGLRVLSAVEHEMHALRAHLHVDAPPALMVLCADSGMHRAVVAYLRQCGVARETIVVCAADNVDAQQNARVVVDTLPARHAAMQSRFCAVVLLRDGDLGSDRNDQLGALLWPALAPHWHEQSLAETKSENRERIDAGRVPGTLIDVLPVIAAGWPSLARTSSREGQALLRIGSDALPTPAGDLFVTTVREQHSDVDLLLPSLSADLPPRWLSQEPSRLLRARQSRPVHKCAYRHQGWSSRDSGLECGLIEMAEADPHIAAYCLFDPQRQPWPRSIAHNGDADNDADAPPACPHALVRTPGYVYVMQFVPYLPDSAARETARSTIDAVETVDAHDTTTAGSAAAAPTTAGRDAMAAWCRRVNMLPADRRHFREWRPVQVQAPLFWSWKRRGGTLSSLLSALADTMPITTRRPRIALPPE